MKKMVMILLAVLCLMGSQARGEAITIENPSFEDPYTGHLNQALPTGWSVDGDQFGTEVGPSDGLQCMFVGGADTLFQLTDQTIAAGDEYTLTFDAKVTWSSGIWPCSYEGGLYYDTGDGTRVPLATDGDTHAGSGTGYAWTEYTVTYTVGAGDAAIGSTLGFAYKNTNADGTSAWAGVDDVSLVADIATNPVAGNPTPADSVVNVDSTVVLIWTAPGALSNPTYDVYLGPAPGSLSLVSEGQPETSYDPALQEGVTYYWRVNAIEGASVYQGNLWSFSTLDTTGSDYYVDSDAGSDSHDGRSPAQAWASLTPVNNTVLLPGDRVLLKAGSVFTDQQLVPQGSGADGNPVIIDRYGSSGDLPRIDANGQFDDAVLVENFEYIEINHLEITNTGASAANNRHGVKLFSNNYGTVHHVHVKNLYVHDVNGSNVKGSGEGLGIFWACSGSTPSNFDDLLIEDCTLIRVDRNGIDGKSSFYQSDSYNPVTQTRSGGNWFPSTNVVVRGNYLEDIGGDCIKIISVDGGLCEYNVAYYGHQRATDCAAGIWNWSTDNVIFQFNESAYQKGGCDGQGFDIDDNCTNTIMQYNYSHDNEGGFMLLCSAPDGFNSGSIGAWNSIVRYNISENDGDVENRVIHYCGQNFYDNYIYNNVFYLGAGQSAEMIKFGNWGDYSQGPHYYWNNIFYADGTYTYSLGASNYFFENNVYYGNHSGAPSHPPALDSDPMLVAPGTGGDGMDTIDGYKLQPSSPYVCAGTQISDNGAFDFWRNRIYTSQCTDIGAHAYTYTHPGDMDVDGDVDIYDLQILASNWLDDNYLVDLNGDGIVDFSDYSIFAQDWLSLFSISTPLTLVVDTESVIREDADKVVGIDLNYVRDKDTNRQPGARSLVEAFSEMKPGCLRFPGGNKSDHHLWSTAPYTTPNPQPLWYDSSWYQGVYDVPTDHMDFDEYMQVCAASGADPYVVVACPEDVWTEEERALYLTNATTWVQYNMAQGYNVKYWEIGNESGHQTDVTAQEMTDRVIELSTAMKAIDPTIKIGSSISSYASGRPLLETLAPHIDFCSISLYNAWEWGSYDYYPDNNPNLTPAINTLENAINALPPQLRDGLEVVTAEINSKDFSEPGWADNNNLGHAIVTFDTLGKILLKPRVNMAMVWNTRWMDDSEASDSIWYALGPMNEILPTGRAVQIWGNFVKETMLATSADSTNISAYASRDTASGDMSIFIVNKVTDTGHPLTITLQSADNYTTITSVHRFGGTGPQDTAPYWNTVSEGVINGNQISGLMLPPVSITVINLKREE